MIRSNFNDEFAFVWIDDPGLDKDHPDFVAKWKEYRRTLDHSVLPTKDKLTVFWCKPLRVRSYSDMMEEPTDTGKAIFAIRACLRRIENLADKDGQPVVLRDTQFQDRGSYRLLSEEALDAFFSPSILGELGGFIVTNSQLDPTRGQGS